MAEPFDMGLVQRGARNRRTPYYEATQKYSPKAFTVYNHMKAESTGPSSRRMPSATAEPRKFSALNFLKL